MPLPEADFPDIAHRRDPEQVAEFVRRKWNLDERPIESMMQLLEGRGVRIFSLPADAADAGTFSLWHRNQPFVLLDAAKPQGELRFELALQLGHLLLHRSGAPAGPKGQHAAGAFAAAFLMPADAICADARHPPALAKLIDLARKWGVPPTAIAHRLHKLELLSDWQYRKVRDQVTAHGAAHEGASAGAYRETSLLLQRLFASLLGRGITKHKIASTVHIYPKDVDELAFGLALTGLDRSAASVASLGRLRPRLTVLASRE